MNPSIVISSKMAQKNLDKIKLAHEDMMMGMMEQQMKVDMFNDQKRVDEQNKKIMDNESNKESISNSLKKQEMDMKYSDDNGIFQGHSVAKKYPEIAPIEVSRYKNSEGDLIPRHTNYRTQLGTNLNYGSKHYF